MSDTSEKGRVYWSGPAPVVCDHCDRPISGAFIDGRTKFGLWASLCNGCHQEVGIGVGPAKGQRFERQANGAWLKVA